MSDSLPPHLLRRPGSLPGTASRGRQAFATSRPAPAGEPAPPWTGGQPGRVGPTLLATPGRPGAYVPALTPLERPKNITVLRRVCQPATPEPWPKDTYLLIGTTGRRAHWTGTDWKLKPSPGYPAGQTVSASTAQVLTTRPEQYGGGERW